MNVDDEYYGYGGGIEYTHEKNSVTDDEDNDEDFNDINDVNSNLHYKKNMDKYRGDSTMSVLNPKSVRERIDETLEILSNLKSRENMKISRSQLLETLSRDLSEYYGYLPELSEFLLQLFSPTECVEYMDASDRPRPLVIRTNTLKSTRKDLMEALSKRGVSVEVIDWSKVAIKITESTVPIGATPEYLGGHYMLQSAASMNPVLALAPQPNERILDMAAAPGGKTSYIAQLMKNSGLVIANDLKPQRQKATVANLHRLGVKNSIVCCHDGRKIPKIMKGFDRVLLDAPCSGLGVISRDPSVKIQRTIKDIQRIAHLQKELLIAAVDSVDSKSSSGGIIVYSTCSISVEENEQVIDYILSKRYVRLVDTGLTVGNPGFTRYQQRRFHHSLVLTKRFYPHVHNMDGFFVAKLQKYENGLRENEEENEENEIEAEKDLNDELDEDRMLDEYVDQEKILKQPITSTKTKTETKNKSDHMNQVDKAILPIPIVEEEKSKKDVKKDDKKSNKRALIEIEENIVEDSMIQEDGGGNDDDKDEIPTLVEIDREGRVIGSNKNDGHDEIDYQMKSKISGIISQSNLLLSPKKKKGKRLTIRELRTLAQKSNDK